MLPDSYQLTTAPANLLIISMKEDHFVQILRNLAMRPPLSPSPPVIPSLSPNLIKQNNEQWRLLLSKSYWTIFHLSSVHPGPGVGKNLTKPFVYCFADPSPSNSSLILTPPGFRKGHTFIILFLSNIYVCPYFQLLP